MSVVRAVVVDDEPLVREELRNFLAEREEIVVVGEAGDGAQAVALLRGLEPDIVFLDVQMPELDGLEVLEALDEEERPPVVFVTAFDEYALTAFQLDAIDYLRKPFDQDRLEECLERIRRRLFVTRGPETAEGGGGEGPEPGSIRRFLVRTRGTTLVVRARDVDWFEAHDNYVRLHVGEKVHLVRSQLTALEDGLDRRRFVRVHRSAIVNLERVTELEPLRTGDCDLFLEDGTVVRMSRRYRQGFEERLQAAP